MNAFTISRRLSVVAIATLAIFLTGCAAHRAQARAKLPLASSVCLQVDGVSDQVKGLLNRKTGSILAEQGFQVVSANCDLTLAFSALDERQWEIMEQALFTRKSSSAYRVEGLASVKDKAGAAISEDQPVDLRDYSSKVELIEALAWELSTYITYNFRPN